MFTHQKVEEKEELVKQKGNQERVEPQRPSEDAFTSLVLLLQVLSTDYGWVILLLLYQ